MPLILAFLDNILKFAEGYLELPFAKKTFHITCLAHPATYVNKILIGSEQGTAELWNINTVRKIYEFSGWSSPIVSMEQAPALDIFAFGLRNGTVVLHNLKTDETLIKFQQDWGAVTTIGFRTGAIKTTFNCYNY